MSSITSSASSNSESLRLTAIQHSHLNRPSQTHYNQLSGQQLRCRRPPTELFWRAHNRMNRLIKIKFGFAHEQNLTDRADSRRSTRCIQQQLSKFPIYYQTFSIRYRLLRMRTTILERGWRSGRTGIEHPNHVVLVAAITRILADNDPSVVHDDDVVGFGDCVLGVERGLPAHGHRFCQIHRAL